MSNIWIIIIALGIFLLFIFLFYLVTHRYVKKEYGMKTWKQWPSQLSYWQAAILYSTGFTVVVMLLLKWSNVLTIS